MSRILDTGEPEPVRRERRLAAEHAVWRTLASADNLEGVAPRILKEVCRAGAWTLGEMWQVDEREQVLRLTDVWNDALNDLDEFIEISWAATFGSGVGLPGRVWHGGSPAWVRDVVDDTNFPRDRAAARAGLHAAFAFPIRIRERVIGVMAFYSPEFREPDPELLESLDLIGGQIGHFIERAMTFQALASSEARWQRIFSGAPIGIFHSRPDGSLIDVNPAFARILGFESPEDCVRTVNKSSIPEILYVDPADRMQFMDKLQAHPGEWVTSEVQGRRLDGSPVAGELHVKWLYEYKGNGPVLEGFVTDVTERRRIDRELRAALDRVRELTLRDHLTGLHNRRHLQERITIEFGAARRTGDDLSVVMFDIDHFKAINDTHGHQAGDLVLQTIAMTLAAEVRPEDVLARYGGEEFVLLMRRTNQDSAFEAAERLRLLVRDTTIRTADGELSITVSCGAASLSECGACDAETLVRIADERLYRAKTEGRDRTCGSPAPTEHHDFVL